MKGKIQYLDGFFVELFCVTGAVVHDADFTLLKFGYGVVYDEAEGSFDNVRDLKKIMGMKIRRGSLVEMCNVGGEAVGVKIIIVCGTVLTAKLVRKDDH